MEQEVTQERPVALRALVAVGPAEEEVQVVVAARRLGAPEALH